MFAYLTRRQKRCILRSLLHAYGLVQIVGYSVKGITLASIFKRSLNRLRSLLFFYLHNSVMHSAMFSFSLINVPIVFYIFRKEQVSNWNIWNEC